MFEPAAQNVVLLDQSQVSRSEIVEAAMDDVRAGRAAIVPLTPGMRAHREPVRTMLTRLVRLAETLEHDRQEDAILKLADIYVPDDLAPARGLLAEDNLAARDRFVAETAPLKSTEVAERAGSRGSNTYATAARWKKEGKVFSVNHRGTEYFPAFQFRDGHPHPSVRWVLAALPRDVSTWQRAFWFVSANGWLDGKTPADCLDNETAVLSAAHREGEALVG